MPTGSAVEGGEEWKSVAGGKRASDEERVCEDVRDGVCHGVAERWLESRPERCCKGIAAQRITSAGGPLSL